MRSKVKISVLIKYIVLCSVALIMLYPLFWVFLSSLKENNEIFSRPFSFPLKPKWDNYSTAWEAADVKYCYLCSLQCGRSYDCKRNDILCHCTN